MRIFTGIFTICFLSAALAPIHVFGTEKDEEESETSKKETSGGAGDLGAVLGGLGGDNLQELLGGFLDGMKQAFGELQKQQQQQPANSNKKESRGEGGGGGGDDKDKGANKVADSKSSSSGDTGAADDGLTGLKNLVDSIDTNQLSQFIKNIASPDNLLDWVPVKFRALVPEQWRSKIGRVLATELDNVGEVWEKLSSYKTIAKFWKAMQKKTPTLAELLTDIWADLRERWAKFEAGLQQESKQYVQNIRATFGHWLSSEVIGKFQTIPIDARQNLRDSMEKAFPALAPLMTKALENEAFRKWAEELMAKKEEVKEEKKEKVEKKIVKEAKSSKKNATKQEQKEEL